MKINYTHESIEFNTPSASIILTYLKEHFNFKSSLDIGCGGGTWLAVAKKLGVKEVFGVDGIDVPNKVGIEKSEFLQYDLTTKLSLSRRFDLGICMEVAEHLPADSADGLVEMLTTHSDVILFSAAIPGQGGQYHINEQWPAYWQSKFKAKGYDAYDIRDQFWDNPNVLWWYRQNTILYVKSDSGLFPQLKKSTSVVSRVHPDLYRKKVFHPKFINNRADLTKSIVLSLRYLVKSIIR